MHGVSEVIAIILILMITISLAGLAYMFMSTTMSDVTSSAGSTVDTTTSSMLISFVIESINQNHVYVRNTGQSALSGLSVYLDDMDVNYTAPTSIAPGSVGTINITSIIFEGDAIRVTSSNGVSVSKPAPLEWYGAVGYWKFDEGYGNYTYDSSQNGNAGTLKNGPIWTNGRYGNALLFDGVNDYVNVGNPSILGSFSVEVWAYAKTTQKNFAVIVGKAGYNNPRITGWAIRTSNFGDTFNVYVGKDNTESGSLSLGDIREAWHHIVLTYNGTTMEAFLDGVSMGKAITGFTEADHDINIGREAVLNAGDSYFNGTIDEVAIWNRSLTSHEIEKLYNKAIY